MDHAISRPAAVRDLVQCQAGSIVSRQIFTASGGNMTLFAFAAGEGLSEHSTPHEATVLILDGEARISIAGDVHIVREGEMLHLPAGVPHAVHGDDDFKMLLTILKEPRDRAG